MALRFINRLKNTISAAKSLSEFNGLSRDSRKIVFYAEDCQSQNFLLDLIKEILVKFEHEVCYLTSDANDTIFNEAKKNGAKYAVGLRARNWMNCGQPANPPKVGNIVVFGWGGKGSTAGHVGIFICQDGENTYCLGGNQTDEVNITQFCILNRSSCITFS